MWQRSTQFHRRGPSMKESCYWKQAGFKKLKYLPLSWTMTQACTSLTRNIYPRLQMECFQTELTLIAKRWTWTQLSWHRASCLISGGESIWASAKLCLPRVTKKCSNSLLKGQRKTKMKKLKGFTQRTCVREHVGSRNFSLLRMVALMSMTARVSLSTKC